MRSKRGRGQGLCPSYHYSLKMAAQGEQEEGTLFNDEDAVSKLEALVFNSLSLGQWESARGHLISLSSHDKGRKTVKEILRSIVLNPKAVW